MVQCLAWVLATGAAVTLSWYGVRTVLTGTAYEPPRALPITDGERASTDTWSSSTRRPTLPSPSASSPSATPSLSSPSPSAPASSSRKPKPDPTPRPTEEPGPEAEGGSVRSYPVRGGRVVFDIHEGWADLVSATPDGGWRMQVWKQPQWIRVDFVSGADTTSVFCTWHDGPPKVRIDGP